MNLIWEEPAAKYTRVAHARRAEIGEELKRNEQQWARIDELSVGTSAATHAHRIRKGDYWGAGYEATSRLVDGQRYVYARYTGEQKS